MKIVGQVFITKGHLIPLFFKLVHKKRLKFKEFWSIGHKGHILNKIYIKDK